MTSFTKCPITLTSFRDTWWQEMSVPVVSPPCYCLWLSKISRLEIFHPLKLGFCFHHFAEAAFAKVINDFTLQSWWQISTSLLFFPALSAAFGAVGPFPPPLRSPPLFSAVLLLLDLLLSLWACLLSLLGGPSNHLTFVFSPELFLFSYFMSFLGDISSNLNVLIFICFGHRLLQQATWNSVV